VGFAATCLGRTFGLPALRGLDGQPLFGCEFEQRHPLRLGNAVDSKLQLAPLALCFKKLQVHIAAGPSQVRSLCRLLRLQVR